MVHSKPQYAESTKLLTYSQLRRLEKLDLKKAREQKLLELARTGLEAGGRAAQGLFSNQIAGTAAFVLGATLLYPAWQPLVWGSLSVLAKDIGQAWRNGVLPNIPSPPSSGPPIITDPSQAPPNGTILGYGIWTVGFDGLEIPGHDRWYNSAAERDLAFLYLQGPGVGILAGDLAPNGPGTSYRKVIARAQNGGVLIS